MCRVSLHYPYRISEILKLTPKAVYIMTQTLALEQKEKILLFARMLGADINEDSEEEKITKEDFERFEKPKAVEKITGEFFGSKRKRK